MVLRDSAEFDPRADVVIDWISESSDNGDRIRGIVTAGHHNMMFHGRRDHRGFHSTEPLVLCEQHGRWCMLKKKVGRFFGRLVGKKYDGVRPWETVQVGG